jgi:mannitol-1-/sugar-/sorbitol-6-phosphatase
VHDPAPRRSEDAPDPGTLWRAAEALLVDLDGTLVDSTGPVRRAWTSFAHRYGLDREWVERFAQGRPSRESVRLLVPDADHAAEAERLEDAELTDLDGVFALPGAAALLRGTRPLAIVTSCSTALARARLQAADLPVPATLVSADDVSHGKPNPESYLLGAQRLGVDPAACLVLEDAPAGITAGRAAGARVIALRTTHSDQDLRDADAIIDDLGSLSAL